MTQLGPYAYDFEKQHNSRVFFWIMQTLENHDNLDFLHLHKQSSTLSGYPWGMEALGFSVLPWKIGNILEVERCDYRRALEVVYLLYHSRFFTMALTMALTASVMPYMSLVLPSQWCPNHGLAASVMPYISWHAMDEYFGVLTDASLTSGVALHTTFAALCSLMLPIFKHFKQWATGAYIPPICL